MASRLTTHVSGRKVKAIEVIEIASHLITREAKVSRADLSTSSP